MSDARHRLWWRLTVFVALASSLVGCSTGHVGDDRDDDDAVPVQAGSPGAGAIASVEPGEQNSAGVVNGSAILLTLPELSAVSLQGAPLKVVATTSVLGDVVSRVGGDAIQLTTLIAHGQDPHSYEPSARDLTAVSDAHVIFVNGWDLEEGLLDDLENIAGIVPLVPISAGIDPLPSDNGKRGSPTAGVQRQEVDHTEPFQGSINPHVWLDVGNVAHWVDNVVHTLGQLDPAHQQTFAGNGQAFHAQLEELAAFAEAQLAQIPQDRRFLVTNHDSLGYFAAAYDFEILGAVIPAASSIAEPSARDLAGLIEKMKSRGVCAIFTETTVSDVMAQTVAAELDHCDEVRVLQLYTGAVGPAGSGADSYVGMMRANFAAIVAGLQE